MGHRPHRPQNIYRRVSNEGVPLDIIELLKSAFMGLVEGITEWLPVSSTGHMILVDEFVKMNVSETFWNMFLVVIQLGAILAVCVLFFHELNPFSPSKGKEGRRDTWVLWGKIVLGCIPAAAIGLPLNDWMEEHFYNAPVVALALIVYGVLFIVIENWRASKREEMAVAGSFGSRAVVSGGRPAGAHFAAPAAAVAEDERRGVAVVGRDGDAFFKNALLHSCLRCAFSSARGGSAAAAPRGGGDAARSPQRRPS